MEPPTSYYAQQVDHIVYREIAPNIFEIGSQPDGSLGKLKEADCRIMDIIYQNNGNGGAAKDRVLVNFARFARGERSEWVIASAYFIRADGPGMYGKRLALEECSPEIEEMLSAVLLENGSLRRNFFIRNNTKIVIRQ